MCDANCTTRFIGFVVTFSPNERLIPFCLGMEGYWRVRHSPYGEGLGSLGCFLSVATFATSKTSVR